MNELINLSMSDEAVCRTAPPTPGLSITLAAKIGHICNQRRFGIEVSLTNPSSFS